MLRFWKWILPMVIVLHCYRLATYQSLTQLHTCSACPHPVSPLWRHMKLVSPSGDGLGKPSWSQAVNQPFRALIHHAAKARWGRRNGWYNGTTDPAIWGRPKMESEDIPTLNESMIALGGSSFWSEGDTKKGDITTCDCLTWQPSKWQKLNPDSLDL